jgi:hypothetical protein
MVQLGIFNPEFIWKIISGTSGELDELKHDDFKLELGDYLTQENVENSEIKLPSKQDMDIFNKEMKAVKIHLSKKGDNTFGLGAKVVGGEFDQKINVSIGLLEQAMIKLRLSKGRVPNNPLENLHKTLRADKTILHEYTKESYGEPFNYTYLIGLKKHRMANSMRAYDRGPRNLATVITEVTDIDISLRDKKSFLNTLAELLVKIENVIDSIYLARCDLPSPNFNLFFQYNPQNSLVCSKRVVPDPTQNLAALTWQDIGYHFDIEQLTANDLDGNETTRNLLVPEDGFAKKNFVRNPLAKEDKQLFIPDCEVLEELGRGASGIVYRVKWRGKDYKVKVFRTQAKDKIEAARKKEGRSLKDVFDDLRDNLSYKIRNFENVTGFYGGGSCSALDSDEDTVYMLMDYVDGGALEYKTEEGEYKIREDITRENIPGIYAGILNGMEVIHNAGLVLKDVKLRNILASKDRKIVRIDDLETLSGFGEVKDGIRLTEGSDRYAAPEVMIDIKNASVHSDVYSLGVCLMHMLTGNAKFLVGRKRLNELCNAEKYHKKLNAAMELNDIEEDKEREFFHKALAFYHQENKPDDYQGPIRFASVQELREEFNKVF